METAPRNIADLNESGRNTIISKLESVGIPEIRNRADSLMSGLVDVADNINQELVSRGIRGLSPDIIESAKRFYLIKAEKQLRGCVKLAINKTMQELIQAFRSGATTLGKLKGRTELVPSKQAQLARDFKISLQNGIVTFSSDNRTLIEPQLDEFESSLLRKIPQAQLSNTKRQRLEGFSNIGAGYNYGDFEEMVYNNQSLKEAFVKRLNLILENRERFTYRKLEESLAIIGYAMSDYLEGETFLDLCTGTGDLANIISSSGYDCVGIDYSKIFLKNARAYRYARQANPNRRDYYINADVTTEELPEAKIWIAKHPCAKGMAIPDIIMSRFVENPNSERLYLLTCCAHKSVGACPEQYVSSGVISNSQEWDNLCKATSAVTLENKDRSEGVNALKSLNNKRIDFINSLPGIIADLVELPSSGMNQMIVVKKVKQN